MGEVGPGAANRPVIAVDPDASEVDAPEVDAVVVGAGFAGLYLLHRLRQFGFSARGFDTAGDVGGTWYWNRYPGARCDIESITYSFQFSEELQQEWVWTERYASQPEILRYIEHVADRFDLRRDITFEARVARARFSDANHLWTVDIERADGGTETVRSRFVLLGSGVLSVPARPNIDGIDAFEGPTFHTGRWPHDYPDFAGMRVGVIGTGSSGIQSIPILADEADHLFVFQRTPNYVVPARNRPIPPAELDEIKSRYPEIRAAARERPSAFLFPFNPDSALAVSDDERKARFDAQWEIGGLPFLGAFGDLLVEPEANRLVTEYWEERVRETVDDPEIAELLIPKDDLFGGKRLCAGTNYLETYNRDDVTLVDCSGGGIEHVTSTGVVVEGTEYELDAIVFATGFDAMTGSVVAIDIAGPSGRTIKEDWSTGAHAFLGMAIHGFPNLFNTQGPGGPGVFVSMVTGIEHQSDWIVDCMDWMRERGLTRCEATESAQDEWTAEVRRAATLSLRPTVDSWYSGANIEGKHQEFMPYIGGFPLYRQHCSACEDNDYAGMQFSPSPA